MTEEIQHNKIIIKGDFVEIKYTGYVEGKPFDSNIKEDLKTLSQNEDPEKTMVIVGQQMVVPGLDNAFEGKEINKEYKIKIGFKEGFGQRHKELVRTIPLKVFAHQKVMPRPGASYVLDNQLARVITISGARVITDFNNPLAGKDLEYKFTIVKTVSDIKEKAETVCKLILRFVPKIEVEDNKVTICGPKILEEFIKSNQSKFKELLNTEVHFKESAPEKQEEKEASNLSASSN